MICTHLISRNGSTLEQWVSRTRPWHWLRIEPEVECKAQKKSGEQMGLFAADENVCFTQLW
jgi:hypothetical protein